MVPFLRRFSFILLACAGFSTGSSRGENVADLLARETQVKQLLEQVTPAVVAITATDSLKNPGSGSGIVVSKDGLILTAAHVIAATGKDLRITFPDGRVVKGEALGANKTIDAAMVRLVEPGPWPHAELGNSDTILLGDWCVALGHPGGFVHERRPPVRLGRIWRRDNDGAIRSSCPLIGGDSGGPLFDLHGKVIGINSSIHGTVDQNRHIALETLKVDWDRMLKNETWGSQRYSSDTSRIPMTGAIFDRQATTPGVRIQSVAANTPAATAGLLTGDLITHCDGLELLSFHAFQRLLLKHKAGDTLRLTIQREAAPPIQVPLSLARRKLLHDDTDDRPDDHAGGLKSHLPQIPEPPPAARPSLGLTLEAQGAHTHITLVTPLSPAAQAGLLAGDQLTHLNDKTIATPGEVTDILRALAPGTALDFRVLRGSVSHRFSIAAQPPAPPQSQP